MMNQKFFQDQNSNQNQNQYRNQDQNASNNQQNMNTFQEKISSTAKSQFQCGLDIWSRLHTSAFDHMMRMTNLGMEMAKKSLRDSNDVTHSVLSARNPQEFTKMASSRQPDATSYSHYLADMGEIADEMRSELNSAFCQQMNDTQQYAAQLLEVIASTTADSVENWSRQNRQFRQEQGQMNQNWTAGRNSGGMNRQDQYMYNPGEFGSMDEQNKNLRGMSDRDSNEQGRHPMQGMTGGDQTNDAMQTAMQSALNEGGKNLNEMSEQIAEEKVDLDMEKTPPMRAKGHQGRSSTREVR